MQRSNVEQLLDKVINTSAEEAFDFTEKVVTGTEELVGVVANMQTHIADLQTDAEDLTLRDVRELLEFLHQWAAELKDWNDVPDLADRVSQFIRQEHPAVKQAA